MNYGIVTECGTFESIEADSLKEGLVVYGICLAVMNSKVAHAFLVDEDFKISNCIDYINDNCYRIEDRIAQIITYEEINLDKLD